MEFIAQKNKENIKEKNKVDLPGLGEMKFLPFSGSEVVGTQFKVVSVDIGDDCWKYLKGNDEKRKELFESHKAFWACGSEIDDNIGVNQFIGLVSHKNQDILQPTVGIEYVRSNFRVGGNLFGCHSWVLGGRKEYQLVLHYHLRDTSFVLVDGYCDTGIKEKIVELIDEGNINAGNLVFVRRYDSDGHIIDEKETKLLEDKLKEKGYPKNAIDGDNYEALAAKGKEMYIKLLRKQVDDEPLKLKNEIVEKMEKKEEKEKKKKKKKKNDISKIGRLFNTVKENKGKVAGGLVVFTTLEELLRRSFFSGEKTNEKEGDSKDLKKLVDQKDTDKYPNRKDKNSAAT